MKQTGARQVYPRRFASASGMPSFSSFVFKRPLAVV